MEIQNYLKRRSQQWQQRSEEMHYRLSQQTNNLPQNVQNFPRTEPRVCIKKSHRSSHAPSRCPTSPQAAVEDNRQGTEGFAQPTVEPTKRITQWLSDQRRGQHRASASTFSSDALPPASLHHRQNRQPMGGPARSGYGAQEPRATGQYTRTNADRTRSRPLLQPSEYAPPDYSLQSVSLQQASASGTSEHFPRNAPEINLHQVPLQRSQSSQSSRSGTQSARFRPQSRTGPVSSGTGTLTVQARDAYLNSGLTTSTTGHSSLSRRGIDVQHHQRGADSAASFTGSSFLDSARHTAHSPHSNSTSGVADAIHEEEGDEGQENDSEIRSPPMGSDGFHSEFGASSTSFNIPSVSEAAEPLIRPARREQITESAHRQATERSARLREQPGTEQHTAIEASFGRMISSVHKTIVENAHFTGSGSDVSKVFNSLHRV